jgi:hypothetical protein
MFRETCVNNIEIFKLLQLTVKLSCRSVGLVVILVNFLAKYWQYIKKLQFWTSTNLIKTNELVDKLKD